MPHSHDDDDDDDNDDDDGGDDDDDDDDYDGFSQAKTCYKIAAFPSPLFYGSFAFLGAFWILRRLVSGSRAGPWESLGGPGS